MRKISGFERSLLGLTLFFLLGTGVWFCMQRQAIQTTEVQISKREPAVETAEAAVAAPGLLEGEILDLNRASQSDLTRLPGIGETRAAAILAYRAEHGGFQTVDELENVSGIGAATMARLRPYIKVEGGDVYAENPGGG